MPIPPPDRLDELTTLMKQFEDRLRAVENTRRVAVGADWRIEQAPGGGVVAVNSGQRVRVSLTSPQVRLSDEPGNALRRGEDGGLFVPGFQGGAAQLVTGAVLDDDPLTVTVGETTAVAERIAEHTFTAGDAVWVLVTGEGWLVIGTVVPPPVPPPALPVPLLWYRADDATGADDDPVFALPSALPGGPGLVSLPVVPGDPGAGGPPRLRVADFGAHQGLEFAEDHSGGWMYGYGDQLFIESSPGWSATIHGGCTVFAVAKVYSGHGRFLALSGPDGGGTPGLLSTAEFAADAFSANPAPADGQNMFRVYAGTTDNTPYVHEWRYDHPGAAISYRMNGVDQAEIGDYDSPSPNTGRATDAVFETDASPPPGAPVDGFQLCDSLNGTWYEIRVYDGVLAGDDLAAVRADLAGIYGIAT